MLNEQAQLLSKKHSQLKQAITKMVQVVMGFLDDTPNKETKMSVIETLRTITEGKVGLKLPGIKQRIIANLLPPDLCRSRACQSDTHSIQHQEERR